MGGCFSRHSRDVDPNPNPNAIPNQNDGQNSIAPAVSQTSNDQPPPSSARPNLPLKMMRWKDKSRLWTADEIRRARAAFWDTRLTYGGQKETWDVLKFVCDELQRMKAAQGRLDEVTILATCQTSLDAAGINLPDGYLCHDVFDESGFRYEIPMYIVCDPDNVVPEGGSSANSTNDDDYDSRGILSNARRSAQLSSAAADEEKINVMTIKCRFSDTTNDVEVDTFPITGNARDLLKRLKKLRPAESNELTLFYYGKRLEKSQIIVDQGYQPNSVISVFVVPSAN